MGLFVNLPGGGASGLHHLLLCRGLYALAQAPHAAKYRDRRPGRRVAARHRLGRGDRQPDVGPYGSGGDHLHVDAAAFLGAVACGAAAIMPEPACRCCRS